MGEIHYYRKRERKQELLVLFQIKNVLCACKEHSRSRKVHFDQKYRSLYML